MAVVFINIYSILKFRLTMLSVQTEEPEMA